MSLLSPGLQAFFEITKQKTVHRAAEELGLTQTAVTQRIKTLENSLETTLFLRSRKGMRTTDEGNALLQYCLAARELESVTLNTIKNSGHLATATLTIAGPTSIMTARISHQCKDIYKKWPKLFLHYNIDDSETKIDLLKNGKAQIVIVRPHQVPNEVDSKTIKSEKFILVGHPSLKGKKISDILNTEKIIDFHKSDPTTINYLKSFNLLPHKTNERIYINNNEVLIRHFCDGTGIGTLTKEVAKPYLEKGKLIKLNRGLELTDPLAIAWYPRQNMPNYFSDVINSIK